MSRNGPFTAAIEVDLIRAVIDQGGLRWSSVDTFGRVAAGGWDAIVDQMARLGHGYTRETYQTRWAAIKERLLRVMANRGHHNFSMQQRLNPAWLVATLADLRLPGVNAPLNVAAIQGQAAAAPQPAAQQQPQVQQPQQLQQLAQQVQQLIQLGQQRLDAQQQQLQAQLQARQQPQQPGNPVAPQTPAPWQNVLPPNYFNVNQYGEMFGSPNGSISSSMAANPPGIFSAAGSPSRHAAPMANLLAVVDQGARVNDIAFMDYTDMDESQRDASRLTLQRMAERMSDVQRSGEVSDYTIRLVTAELQQQWSQLRSVSLSRGDQHAYDNLGAQPGRAPERRLPSAAEGRSGILPPPRGGGGPSSGGHPSSSDKGKGVDR